MSNDNEQAARLRSFDLTNLVAQHAADDDAGDAQRDDDDDAVERSDDSMRVER